MKRITEFPSFSVPRQRFDEIEFYYKCTYFSILIKELTIDIWFHFHYIKKKKKDLISQIWVAHAGHLKDERLIIKGLSKRLGL